MHKQKRTHTSSDLACLPCFALYYSFLFSILFYDLSDWLRVQTVACLLLLIYIVVIIAVSVTIIAIVTLFYF